MFADRLFQVVLAVVLFSLSGGFAAHIGTKGGHEDFATYRLTPHGSNVRRELANAHRLKRANDGMRPKFEAIIADLEGHGFKPFVDDGIYRTPAQQREKVRRGVSKVGYSYHNVTAPDGSPDALAADIADQNWGWSPKTPRKYWLMLASAAENHECETGIYWGLSKKERAILRKAIRERNWNYQGRLGWDVAHVQPARFSIGLARRGLRPFSVFNTRPVKKPRPKFTPRPTIVSRLGATPRPTATPLRTPTPRPTVRPTPVTCPHCRAKSYPVYSTR